MPYEQLIADAGYDSEANHRFCREQLRVDSLICSQEAPLCHGGRYHALSAGDGQEVEQGRQPGGSCFLPTALEGPDGHVGGQAALR